MRGLANVSPHKVARAVEIAANVLIAVGGIVSFYLVVTQ